MSQIHAVTGRAIALQGNDIDTDRIIPARYLRSVTFDGLGEAVFIDDRTQAQGKHPFDAPHYQGAEILVVNRNFGCGSSREHAPQAIMRWGIKAIIGESFAEIFFGNCIAIGMPCLSATTEIVESLQSQIQSDPSQTVQVDLATLQVTYGTWAGALTMAEGPRQMFLTGSWDATGQLIQQSTAIRQTAQNLPYLTWQTSRAVS
jgi:3-isopropylmalate/(R)-2-methylmalate dehydratase small subunit